MDKLYTEESNTFSVVFMLKGNYLELPENVLGHFQGFCLDYTPGTNEYKISFFNDMVLDAEIISNFRDFIEECGFEKEKKKSLSESGKGFRATLIIVCVIIIAEILVQWYTRYSLGCVNWMNIIDVCRYF